MARYTNDVSRTFNDIFIDPGINDQKMFPSKRILKNSIG